MLDPAPPPDDAALASIGARFAARLIDGLVLAVPAFAVIAATVDLDDRGSLPLSTVLALSLGAGLYEVLLTAWRGQTVGKMALRIRVVRTDTGAPPTLGPAAIRYLLPAAVSAVPVIGPFLSLAVYLPALRDPRRQGFHDRAAATVVVRAP